MDCVWVWDTWCARSFTLILSCERGVDAAVLTGIRVVEGMLLSLFLRGVGIVGHVPEEDEKMGDEENERHETLNEKSTSQDSADTRS